MNQTLEEMARALFKSWFVDFDPVHAKATLKHKHHALTPSHGGSDWTVERARAYLDRMDPNIAALFPNSFVDSDLEPIPEGWEVKALGECATQRRRGVSPEQFDSGTPYIALEHMPKHFQPREVDVPENDPFKNDLLGRKESVEVLTHLVGSLEGPCVLAVDAAWGSGKTTFLRIWAQHLRNQGFAVVEFNAWETDFAGDPFVSLSTELTEGLRAYPDETLATKIDGTRKVAAEVIRRAVPGLIRVATAGILDVSPLME